MKITPEIKQEILNQIKEEYNTAKQHKDNIIGDSWDIYDKILEGKKTDRFSDDVSSNIDILKTKIKGFRSTLLSKVDTAPNIKFEAPTIADKKKVDLLNALIEQEASSTAGNWNQKDLQAKRMSIFKGRGVFKYYTWVENKEFRSKLEVINLNNFLIDPNVDPLDIDTASYLGVVDVLRTKHEIENSSLYNKADVKALIEKRSEKIKDNRYYTLSKDSNTDNLYMVEWYTTYKGVKYYVFCDSEFSQILRIEPLKNLFKTEMYPFATFSTDEDQLEFWNKSPIDDVFELFKAQHILLNQALDNNEKINNPMRVFKAGALTNPSQLRYKPHGVIEIKKEFNVSDVLTLHRPDMLKNNESLYALFDELVQKESGITDSAKGLSEETRLGIYKGNQANANDRLGLQNKSYKNCYSRIGLMFHNGCIENMNQQHAVRIAGMDGIEILKITKSDITLKNYDIRVVSSDVMLNSDTSLKQGINNFLSQFIGDQTKNQKVIFEILSEINGLTPDQLQRILNVELFGDEKVLGEASYDFEMLVKGENVKLNTIADISYKQYFVDTLLLKQNDIEIGTIQKIEEYINKLDSIIEINMKKKANSIINQQSDQQLKQ